MTGRQHHIDSLMETVCGTAVGFVVSLVTWQVVAAAFRIPMPLGNNLIITGIFTVVSLVRQYLIRRAFNGRSIWQAIKSELERIP